LDVTQALEGLAAILAGSSNRTESVQRIAEIIRCAGNYRWVRIYDVSNGTVANIAWSGPQAPTHPVFPITQGLTGAALAERKTVNVADVSKDVRYLTALGDTLSEIIVPVLDTDDGTVVGTIDVESDRPNAFDAAAQSFLEGCSKLIRGLRYPSRY
jgi:L-methionine (R)-S-oxide reductase